MNINNWNIKLYALLLILCLNTFVSKAQSFDSFPVRIDWRGVENINVNGEIVEFVSFNDASYDNYFDEKNPVYRHVFPIYSDEVEVD